MNRIHLLPISRRMMGLTVSENSQVLCRNCWSLPLSVALLCAVSLGGCSNSCFAFVSNLPVGTTGTSTSDLGPVCKPTTSNGAVRAQMDTVLVCGSCAGSTQVQHIFLSIQGVEVHPSALANDDSPDWQELLPAELVKQPLQIDLVRGTAVGGAREPLGEFMAIPAGIYRQVRLRLVSNQTATEYRLPERNACGGVGFNCVVVADGRIQPLLLDAGSPKLLITSDSIEGGSFFIPPETETDLIIELKPVWALFSSAHDGVRLLPTLAGSVKVKRVDFDELGITESEGVHDSLSMLGHN